MRSRFGSSRPPRRRRRRRCISSSLRAAPCAPGMKSHARHAGRPRPRAGFTGSPLLGRRRSRGRPGAGRPVSRAAAPRGGDSRGARADVIAAPVLTALFRAGASRFAGPHVRIPARPLWQRCAALPLEPSTSRRMAQPAAPARVRVAALRAPLPPRRPVPFLRRDGSTRQHRSTSTLTTGERHHERSHHQHPGPCPQRKPRPRSEARRGRSPRTPRDPPAGSPSSRPRRTHFVT